jgi:hypothetical protein
LQPPCGFTWDFDYLGRTNASKAAGACLVSMPIAARRGHDISESHHDVRRHLER